MKKAPPEEIRLRFHIAVMQQLGSLLQDGYSREEHGKRLDRLIRAFTLAMYQRVIESRKTGFLADTVWFNLDLGTEIVRVVVRMNPTNQDSATMELADKEPGWASSCINN